MYLASKNASVDAYADAHFTKPSQTCNLVVQNWELHTYMRVTLSVQDRHFVLSCHRSCPIDATQQQAQWPNWL
jgi:hypothetical protein